MTNNEAHTLIEMLDMVKRIANCYAINRTIDKDFALAEVVEALKITKRQVARMATPTTPSPTKE